MGVGAEVNAGQPAQRFIPGVGMCWEYSWGWREYIGPGADGWHASTDTATHLTAAEHAAVTAAARQTQAPALAVAAVLASSRGATAWEDAQAEARARSQYGALLARCVAVYG